MELVTLRARVRGRVQNVGFRVFVREVARGLNVAGYVRNEYEGSVFVEAVGPRGELERLLGSLQRGPSQARVERLEVDWLAGNPRGLSGQFEVSH